MRHRLVLTGLVAMVTGLVGLPTMAAEERTHVLISGPRQDWHPRPRLLLEIGGEEWVVSGSLAVRATTDLPTTVVVRDLGDCRTLFSFTARDRGPGGGYTVAVGQGRTFRLRPGRGFSEGPYVPPAPGDRCPDLPDTSTAGTDAMAPVQSAEPSPGQSPSPGSPPPALALNARDEAMDERFRLAIETDSEHVTTDDVIEIRTTWTYLGTDPVRICTGGGGPVIFMVEQLDGFFDPGGGGDDSGRLMTVQPGDVDDVPFQKSGGYSGSDPMAPLYEAWFDDPLLRLPAGAFRITAHAEYAVDDCGAGSLLEASVVVRVDDPAAPTSEPSPSLVQSPGTDVRLVRGPLL